MTQTSAAREAAITKMVEFAMRISLSGDYQWRDYMGDLYDIAINSRGVETELMRASNEFMDTLDKSYSGIPTLFSLDGRLHPKPDNTVRLYTRALQPDKGTE